MKLKQLLIVIAGLLFMYSCGSEGESSGTRKDNKTSGEIYIAVDEAFAPILEEHIVTFQRVYPDAKINLLQMPAEKAIAAMVNSDSVRLAVATRKPTQVEMDAVMSQNSAKIRSFDIAKDAIGLIVSKENKDSTLTQAQLRKILLGELVSWKDINPKSPYDQIQLVIDNGYSSTVADLQKMVLGDTSIRAKVVFKEDNVGVMNYVAQTPSALGVIGVGWISNSSSDRAKGFKSQFRVVELEGLPECKSPDKYFQPYQVFIKAGCYPLSRYVYVLNREPHMGLGTGFVTYLTEEKGQRIILKAGLVPTNALTRVVKFPPKEGSSSSGQ